MAPRFKYLRTVEEIKIADKVADIIEFLHIHLSLSDIATYLGLTLSSIVRYRYCYVRKIPEEILDKFKILKQDFIDGKIQIKTKEPKSLSKVSVRDTKKFSPTYMLFIKKGLWSDFIKHCKASNKTYDGLLSEILESYMKGHNNG